MEYTIKTNNLDFLNVENADGDLIVENWFVKLTLKGRRLLKNELRDCKYREKHTLKDCDFEAIVNSLVNKLDEAIVDDQSFSIELTGWRRFDGHIPFFNPDVDDFFIYIK